MTESKSNLPNCYKIDYWFAKVVGMLYVYSFHTLEEINRYKWYFDQKKKNLRNIKVFCLKMKGWCRHIEINLKSILKTLSN